MRRFIESGCDVARAISGSVALCLVTAVTHGGTVTWTGAGDGESWNLATNWSSNPNLPGPSDDVFHDNDDIIQLNTGSAGSPVVINSFTVEGAAVGGLVIQSGRRLDINGDFINTNTDPGDRYELTMESNSILNVTSSGNTPDFVRINVTMEPVTSGDPTTLNVDGVIISGDFDVNEGCIVTAGIDSGAGRSVLDGNWTLSDGANVEFHQEMGASPNAPLVFTLQGGSRLFVAEAYHTDPTTFYTDQAHQVLYGEGDNSIDMGPPYLIGGLQFAPAFELGPHAHIGRLTNTGSLTITTLWLIPYSFFGYQVVREGWDTRSVDIVSPAFDSSETIGASFRIDMISSDFKDWFPDVPVIFLDVPCIGAWRDLIIPDAESEDIHPTGISDEENNAITDDFSTSPGQSPDPEVGFFRNVEIGANRTFIFPTPSPTLGQTRLFYYGTKSIDSTATLLGPEGELTGSGIDDFIVPAVGTIYGDWDGDCEITAQEISDLRDAIDEEEYNPLYDYDCDGVLDADIEGAAATANYAQQPSCGESLMGGGGGGSMMASSGEEWFETLSGLSELESLAAWISASLTATQLAEFIADLEEKAEELSGTALGYEMASLLAYFE